MTLSSSSAPRCYQREGTPNIYPPAEDNADLSYTHPNSSKHTFYMGLYTNHLKNVPIFDLAIPFQAFIFGKSSEMRQIEIVKCLTI